MGEYTKENDYKYINLYRDNDTINLYLKFSVFIDEKGKLIKLWDIYTPNTDNIIYHILEQGVVVVEKINELNHLKSTAIYKYNMLKIKFKTDAYLDYESLNFKLDKNNI